MDRIPILKIGSRLLATIQSDLHDAMALQLEDDLAESVVRYQSDGVIVDVSALDVVDSYVGRMLAHMASVTRLLGADTVVVGIRPAVAITLVELGLSLGDARTALTVEHAFAYLDSMGAERQAEADSQSDAHLRDGAEPGGGSPILDPLRLAQAQINRSP